MDIVQDVLGGIMTAVSAVLFGFAQRDELGELAFLTFGGALSTFILKFLFTFFLIAPEKLHKEQEKKIKSLEAKLSQRGDLEQINLEPGAVNERQKIPIYTTILLVCVSCCLFLLVFQSAKNYRAQKQTLAPQKEAMAKALPDKSMPNPTNPVPPQGVACTSPPNTKKPPKQAKFETNEPSDGLGDGLSSIISSLAKAKADRAAKEEKDKLAAEEAREEEWKTGLAHWRFALQSLYDVLKAAAERRGDGITKTEGYFQCLEIAQPKQDVDNTKLAEIRFTNRTNVDFLISLKNENGAKALLISTDCGTVEVYHWDHKMEVMVDISRFDYHDNVMFASGNEHDAINKQIKTLVSSQLYFVEHSGK
jgi:hypothetical protein